MSGQFCTLAMFSLVCMFVCLLISLSISFFVCLVYLFIFFLSLCLFVCLLGCTGREVGRMETVEYEVSPPGPSGVSVTYSPWVKNNMVRIGYGKKILFRTFSHLIIGREIAGASPWEKETFKTGTGTTWKVKRRYGWKLPWEQWVCKFCSLKQPKLALFSNTAICVRAIPKQINRTPMQIWIYDIHVWLEIAETYILIVSLPFAIRYLTIACINSVWCYNSNKFFSFKYWVVYFRNI